MYINTIKQKRWQSDSPNRRNLKVLCYFSNTLHIYAAEHEEQPNVKQIHTVQHSTALTAIINICLQWVDDVARLEAYWYRYKWWQIFVQSKNKNR